MISALNILLAEDNEDEVFLLQHAIKKAKVAFCLHVVKNGLEAQEAEQIKSTGESRSPLWAGQHASIVRNLEGFSSIKWGVAGFAGSRASRLDFDGCSSIDFGVPAM